MVAQLTTLLTMALSPNVATAVVQVPHLEQILPWKKLSYD
jgi:hypothetical protein